MVRASPSHRTWVVVAVCVVVLLHAPSFTRPLLDSDEAVYASIAALVQDGGRLYSEGGVDNKFPGIYWTYAAVFTIFGHYAMLAVHVLALAVVLSTCFVLARLAARIGSRRAGLLAFLFYGVLTTFYYPKMLAANTEIFMMLPLAVSVLLSVPDGYGRSRRFSSLSLAGALIGIAALYRQLAALNLLLSSVAPLVCSEERRSTRFARASAPLLGFAGVFALVVATFAIQGSLRDFWFWTVAVTTTRYLPRGWHYGWPGRELLAVFAVMSVPWLLVVLRARRLRRASLTEKLVWLWLPLSLLAFLVLWRFHAHYVIHALGPVAVLAAVELDRWLGETSGRLRSWLIGASAALTGISAVAFAILALLWEPVAGGFAPVRPDYPRVARVIRERTTPAQRVFVWGAYSALYVLSERLPASRFVGFMRGCPRNAKARPEACWDSGPEVWPLLIEDLERTHAELVVDTSLADYGGFRVFPLGRFPSLNRYVAQRYRLEETIDGVALYRRRNVADRVSPPTN